MAGVDEVLDRLSSDFGSGESVASFRRYDKSSGKYQVYNSPRRGAREESEAPKNIDVAKALAAKDANLASVLRRQDKFRKAKDGLGDWSQPLMGLSFGGNDFSFLLKYRRPEYWCEFSQGTEVLFGDESSQFDFDPYLDKAKLDDVFAVIAVKNMQRLAKVKLARASYLEKVGAAKKIQRLVKEKIDFGKVDLTLSQKTAKYTLSSVASGVGAVMVLEGWLQWLNNVGIAGSGFVVTNPIQLAVFMGVMGLTYINYLVNYRMYKAKVEEAFVAQELERRNQQNLAREDNDPAAGPGDQAGLAVNNQEQMAAWKKYLLKFLKLVLGVSIALYTVAFFFASFQNEFLFREFCGKFMSQTLLNQQSFTQLVAANPVGAVFSIIFLIAALLAAGCQFYFAVSSLLKRSPAESLEKMKNYFKKINPLNKKVSCVKSDEDLHSDFNLILSKHKLFAKEQGKHRLSLLSLEEKVYLIAALEGLPVKGLSKEQRDIFIKHKISQYRVKSKTQSRLEVIFKLIGVGLFVLTIASLAIYFAPLVMTMLPIGIAFKCILGISWASLILARLPICFESCFWGAERFSALICNYDAFKFKWQGHGKRLRGIIAYNIVNAVANVALSFFAGASGVLSYGFAASMFFLSLVITTKPSFEKNKVKVKNGVIQKEDKPKSKGKSCFSSAWQGAKNRFNSLTSRNAGEGVGAEVAV